MIRQLRHPVRHWLWRRRTRGRPGQWPDPCQRVVDAPLLAVDLEMTGLDARSDEIVSLGWVAIDQGAIDLSSAREIRVSRSSGVSVGHSATIHGLRDCDLGDQPDLDHGLRALLAAVRGRIAVFHHAALDLAFLDRACRRHVGQAWPTPFIDTLQWFRKRLHLARPADHAARGEATLAAASRHFGLVQRSRHGALEDALSCAELVLALGHQSRARLVEVARLPPK